MICTANFVRTYPVAGVTGRLGFAREASQSRRRVSPTHIITFISSSIIATGPFVGVDSTKFGPMKVKIASLAALLFWPATAAAFSPASTKLALPALQRTILSNVPRHDVRSNGPSTETEIDPEEMKIQAALADHQQRAPKLGFDVDVRSLVQYNHGFAVMSTNSKA